MRVGILTFLILLFSSSSAFAWFEPIDVTAWQGRYAVFDGEIVDLDELAVVEAPAGANPECFAVSGGELYVGRDDRQIYAVSDLGRGAEREFGKTEGSCLGLWASGGMVTVAEPGLVRYLDEETGKETGRLESGKSEFVQALRVGDRLALRREDGSMLLVGLGLPAVAAAIRLKQQSVENTTDDRLYAPAGLDGFCLVLRLETGFVLRCFDRDGRSLWSRSVEHTIVIEEEDTRHYESYLRVREFGSKNLFFTSSSHEQYAATRVVRLTDGKVVFDGRFASAGMVEGADGELAGVLRFDAEGKVLSFVQAGSMEVRWSLPVEGYANTVAARVAGNRLLVASYHEIATGSALTCYDVLTGELLWRGDVEQMNVDHSKYYNQVDLILRGSHVFMLGREAGGSYVQVFDVKTGEKKFGRIRKTW